MSLDTSPDANAGRGPLAGEDVVDEVAFARDLGISVSELRAMLSGKVDVPDEFKELIPEPERETRMIWRAEDIAGLGDRFRELADRQRIREQEQRAAEEQRQHDIYLEQNARKAQHEADARAFGPAESTATSDLMLPATRREIGFWGGLLAAWKQLTAKNPAKDASELTITEATDGYPMANPLSYTSRQRSTGGAPEADAPVPASAPDSEAEAAKAAREAEKTERARAREEAAAVKRAEKQRAAEERQAAKEAARLEREAAKEAAAQKAEKPAKVKKPKKAKAAAAVAADGEAIDKSDLARQKKHLAKQRKVEQKLASEKAKEAEKLARQEAKEHKARAKKAKAERLARYKADLATWKENVEVAKATGVTKPRKPKRPKSSTDKPKPLDVINAVRAFATMLDNSPGELESLDTMLREYEGTQIGEAFRRIHYRMNEQNATLVEAFAPEKLFPAEVHNMLRVGAKTISPGPSLRVAVNLMDSANDNKRKLFSEIREPVLIGVLSLGVLFATAWLMMPSFVEMYASLEIEIPTISAAILVMSDVTVWVLGILFGFVAAYTIWWFAYGRRWDRWRTAIDTYKLHMPLMGKANQAQETHHVLKVLHSYMSVGSPEREALADAAAATSNRAVRKHLETTAELMIQGRTTFAGTFDTDLFPNMVRNIIATGERSGRVEETIGSLVETYEREAKVESEQAVAAVSGAIAGVSSLIFGVIVTMVSVPPLEMFGATLSYGQ